jgi:CRISPR/Cas system-associated exonuclease Cas4 (RecB family)
MNKLFDVSILDSSKIATFQKCPRLFLFQYLLGWQSRYTNHHLAFGSAFHEAQEVLWSAVPNVTVDVVKNAVARFEESFDELTNFDDSAFWKAKTRENGAVAIVEYAFRYKEDFKNYEVLLVEKSGQVPTSEEMDMIVVKIDTIVRDNRDGLVYVVEHKTAGQRPVDIWDVRLQINAYYHALNACYGPKEVGGVIVDVAIIYKPGTPAGRKRIDLTGTSNGFERFLVVKDGLTMMDGLDTINEWITKIKTSYAMLEVTQDPHTFPKCGEACYSYGSRCAFYDICSSAINPLELTIPSDLVIREWNPLEEFESVENFKL